MIMGFKHKGLRLLFEADDDRSVPPMLTGKIKRILGRLHEATAVKNMALPGYRLHSLKGNLAGFWSVTVSGNHRIIFRFEGGNAYDVDFIDYH